MNPYLLLAAVRARFRVLLFVLAATVLVTTVVSLLLPKTYVATVAMLVDSKDDQSMNHTVEANVRERIGYIQTQVDIISSQKVARKVVHNLGLADQAEALEAFTKATDGVGSIEDWLAMGMLKELKVDTSTSSVIHIGFPSADAQFSADVANAFAKAYMATALELRVEPSRQTAAWFDEQMKGLRSNLDQAQVRLTDFQKTKGLLDERFDVDSMALADLSSEVVKAQARRAGTAAPENHVVAANQNARAELQRSENKLAEMSTRLGVNHPWYQRQLAETQNLRGRVRAETTQVGPTAQNQRRVTELRKELETQQTRLLEMKQYRYQLGVLARDVEMAQKAYETAMQHSVDKRIESRASLTNINILHSAVAPFTPTRPRIFLNIGLSIVVGLLLGLCIIYLMELLDHRVRSLGDLKSELLVPVLAELSAWHPAALRHLGPPDALPTLSSPS
jgi:chain length determinant protein EpsF